MIGLERAAKPSILKLGKKREKKGERGHREKNGQGFAEYVFFWSTEHSGKGGREGGRAENKSNEVV